MGLAPHARAPERTLSISSGAENGRSSLSEAHKLLSIRHDFSEPLKHTSLIISVCNYRSQADGRGKFPLVQVHD